MKKLFSCLLALTLIITMGMSAMASSSSDKPTDIVKSIDTNGSITGSVMAAGKKLTYPLTADMFTWSSGTAKGKDPVLKSQLKGFTVDSRNKDSSVIKDIELKDVNNAVSGKKSACVIITFVDEWDSVDSKDFSTTVFLRLDRSRKAASEIELSDTFENQLVTIDSDEDYYAIGKGMVIEANGYIKSIDLELGDGVILNTKLYEGRKYYGYATAGAKNEDDAVMDKYGDYITEVYTLFTINLKNGKVSFDAYDGQTYVYNKSGKYLGTADKLVEYSDKYYLTTKKIDMGGGAVSSTASSSSSEASSSEASSSSTEPTLLTGITADAINDLAKTAVSSAKASGSKTATVRIKDAESISADALKAMQKTVAASGLKGQLNADIMSGKTVTGRITIDPSLAASLTGSINLGVFVGSSYTKDTKAKFDRVYSNDLQVISLAQTGRYGMTVNIAAKVDLSDIDTGNIYLYSYDKSANTIQRLTNAGITIDKSGYLHFKTSIGNDIIVSEGALTKA